MGITSFFILILAYHLPYGVSPTTLSVFNNCPCKVWPGIFTANGTSSTTGFVLGPQELFNITVSNPWTGQIWGRYGCSDDSGKLICNNGDCGTGEVSCDGKGWTPPATVVDISVGPAGEADIYDVSLVDGFNLPVSVHPVLGGSNCGAVECSENINNVCLDELALKYPDDSSVTIGCKSACDAFNQSRYCCTDDYDNADACQPSIYSKFFKGHCPMAYSYPYDDDSLSFVCKGSPAYGIIFCP